MRPTCCFLIAIATFNLRPFSTRLSPSRRTRLASSSVSNVMNPYLRQQRISLSTSRLLIPSPSFECIRMRVERMLTRMRALTRSIDGRTSGLRTRNAS